MKRKSIEPTKEPSSNLLFERLKEDGELMLLQLQDWYRHRDGVDYKHVWGRVRLRTTKQVLGFDPRGGMTNFLYQIGDGAEALFVMGCRIHYAQICLEVPSNRANVLIGSTA